MQFHHLLDELNETSPNNIYNDLELLRRSSLRQAHADKLRREATKELLRHPDPRDPEYPFHKGFDEESE